jgi:cephalosporin hydroxylase
VIAVDIDLTKARAGFARLPAGATAGIELIEGDLRDDAVMAQIRRMIPADAEVFIIEDAQHDADTTLAALRGLAGCVSPGGYYMVEDTCVDVENLRVSAAWPRGAGLAVERWLADDELGRMFRRRPDLQPYGLTCHPGGLLQRIPVSTE